MTRTRKLAAGFTLLEALVALAVTSFALVSLFALQNRLSTSADVAKQRTEAMRLAQETIEGMRSFTGIGTGVVNWNGLASGSDTIGSYTIDDTSTQTNTQFTRTWTLAGVAADPMRAASVTVAWTDRVGDLQSVVLNSVISKTDPADAGFLAFPLAQNTNLKRPKNRNINIPVQATELGDGKSAYQLAANYAIIFSDTSGYVVEKCNTTVTAANYATAGCTSYPAYILAGYVSGSVGNTPLMPTGVNTTALTGWDSSGGKTISCTYAQARDQNTSALISGSHYYICVIPITSDDSGNVTGTYSGTVRLGGVGTSSDYKVCRFQYAANDFVTGNQRNVQPYAQVAESLDNQNYYLENSSGTSCPAVSAVPWMNNAEKTALSGVVDNLAVTPLLHQDCRNAVSPSTAADGSCPASAHNTGP